MSSEPDKPSRFEEAKPGNTSLPAELGRFLMQNKKWWLAPLLIALALMAVVLVLSASPAAPFIYTLF
ncbi:MAG: DUF5989 family protein [Polyangiaceae bacterium]